MMLFLCILVLGACWCVIVSMLVVVLMLVVVVLWLIVSVRNSLFLQLVLSTCVFGLIFVVLVIVVWVGLVSCF